MKEGKILIKIQAGVTFELFKKMLLHPMLTVITIFSVGNLIGNCFDSIFEKKKCEMMKQKVMHSVLKIREGGNTFIDCVLVADRLMTNYR